MIKTLMPSDGGCEQAQVRTRFSLVCWLSVTSFLSVTIVSATMAFVLSKFMTDRFLERDAEVGMAFVQSIVKTQKVAEYFAQRGGRSERDIVEFLDHVAAMPDVLRANIYAPDGTLLWSSRTELIGQRFEPNNELEDALRGNISISRGDLLNTGMSKPEHALFGEQPFVEYYFPVRDLVDRRIIGVVELYKVPRTLWDTIDAGKRLIWTAALVGGSFLYASVIGLALRADRMLRCQEAKLLESEGLALIGEMSAAVAHSIRNPLASIRTSAELTRELAPDPDLACTTAGDIMRQVDRIEILLRTLLSYARDPLTAHASADPGQLVRTAVERFRSEFAAQGTQINASIAMPLPRVRGDGALILQVLHSVIANALEATGTNDRVTVSVVWPHQGAQVSVIVTDTGTGIAPEQLKQIFKPFFTTKACGLGVGLALARRIVERLGGTIDLQSTLGHGSCLTVRLPAEQ